MWFIIQYLRYLFPPLFETLKNTYMLSNSEVGLLFTLLLIGYGAMQFPSGALADRYGMIKIIFVGILVSSSASLFIIFQSSFNFLLLLSVLIGVGTGMFKTVSINLISTLYSNKKGFSLGFMDSIGVLGGVFAPPTVVLFLSARTLNWEHLFLISGLANIILVLLLVFRASRRTEISNLRETTSTKSIKRSDGDRRKLRNHNSSPSYLTLFRKPNFLAFVLATMCLGFSWSALTSFLPLYLTDEKGLSTTTAGFVFSGFFILSLIQLITGKVSDRISPLWIMFGLGLITGTFLLINTLFTSIPLVIFSTLMVGLGIHGTRPVRDSYFMELIPQSIGGGTLGLVRTLIMIITAPAPAIIGYLSDVAGFQLAMGIVTLSVFLYIGLIGTLLVSKKYIY
jgi:sugar phosphate permease